MKYLVIFLLLSTLVSAQEIVSSGDIVLLALKDGEAGKSGTVATLTLELRPGNERVFLETFPLTKVTTQASLRFAQQIACKQTEVDCSKYDFLYTIRALPGIVGGPSAGAAAALLTAGLLLNKTIPQDVAVTGTINSGGIIGPVGGLKYKIEAATGNNIKTVFLAKGTKDVKEKNETLDLIKYGRELNLTVREVATLGEVLELTLGIPQDLPDEDLRIEGRYMRIMQEVSNDLCDRTAEFLSKPLKANLTQVKNFTDRASTAQSQGTYYAAASYCFRANVDYKRAWYQEQNFSRETLQKKADSLKNQAENLQQEFESKKISTLTDLQTFMAVMERVTEALDLVKKASEELEHNQTDSAGDIGYAEERLFSGITWGRFFNGQDQLVVIDEDSLKSVCVAKISEAEERFNYVKSIIPDALDATKDDIDAAYRLLRDKKYIMCLYRASKAKSEADVLLSLMGVEEEHFDEVIDLKLDIALQALIKAQRKNVFPIIAYSYYEYGKSLREFDRVSALLFTEYSLELANLDIYFQEKKPVSVVSDKTIKIPPAFYAFITGLAMGGFIILVIMIQLMRSSTRKIKTLQAPRKRRLRGKKR